ncbi:eukaryotic translation initiation factor 3 subunit A [Oxalobacter formigenes HOxBLS]|uniref:Eukaryotic translation initiation factor 3 subunit A n=1 Tax=Oxalobacter paraformigenes TaxID=556268 RepID=T5LUS9_9BURK|nr:eukaryotic translation initiation factor 3 subunit A [Oxalobacter paraformigenes]
MSGFRQGSRMPDGAEAASRYDRAFDFFSMRGFPDIVSGGGLSKAGLACFWRPRSGRRIAVSGGSGFWRRRLVQGVWFLDEPDRVSGPCFHSPCRIKRPVESFEGGFSAMGQGVFPRSKAGFSVFFPRFFPGFSPKLSRVKRFRKTGKPGRQAGLRPFLPFFVHPVSEASLLWVGDLLVCRWPAFG